MVLLRAILSSWLCIFSSPLISNSAFISTFSHPAAIFTIKVRTWSLGEDCAQQHSVPIQFSPPQQVDWLSAHFIRFGFFRFAVRMRPMRIDADWMLIQFPVRTGQEGFLVWNTVFPQIVYTITINLKHWVSANTKWGRVKLGWTMQFERPCPHKWYIVIRGNSDHGVIQTIGHVVYYCVQWSELPQGSRRTEEAHSRFLHVYSFSKLILRALHRFRCLVTRLVWLEKVWRSQKRR